MCNSIFSSSFSRLYNIQYIFIYITHNMFYIASSSFQQLLITITITLIILKAILLFTHYHFINLLLQLLLHNLLVIYKLSNNQKTKTDFLNSYYHYQANLCINFKISTTNLQVIVAVCFYTNCSLSLPHSLFNCPHHIFFKSFNTRHHHCYLTLRNFTLQSCIMLQKGCKNEKLS